MAPSPTPPGLFGGVDEHRRHFRSAEFGRRRLARAQHVAHLRAAQHDVRLGPVRAGLGRCHGAARATEEGVIEEQWLDAQLARRERAEDVVRVVGAVVVADAGMVAADDEVRAAVVLADQGVEDRLARTGVAHGGREDAQQDAVGRVVVVEQHPIAAHAHVGGNVVVLGLADQRVQQQAVGDFEGALLQVLVGAVDRVAGLEADDRLPLAFGEGAARLDSDRARTGGRPRRARCAPGRGSVHPAGLDPPSEWPPRPGGLDHRCDTPAPLRAPGRARRSAGGRARRARHPRRRSAPPGCPRLAASGVGRGQGDRNRPRQAIAQAHALDDGVVVGLVEKSFERAEAADGDHVQVRQRARSERQARQREESAAQRRRFGQGCQSVDQLPAVRRDLTV